MSQKEDQLFGRLALTLRLITPQQLNECLADQRERGAKGLRAPLGSILKEKGLLSDAQLAEILQKQRGTTRRFQVIGPYLIERKLGDGPMGIVYKALDRNSQKYVALRVLPGRLQREPGLLDQVKRRLEAAQGLRHPHLVAIEAVGEAAGFHYAASEWVEGESLAAALAREGTLDEIRAVRYTYEIASALQLLHDRRLVHRALRPENVFLDSAGRARLADFGLLRLDLEERLGPSISGVLGGTTEYVSPEASRDPENADPRSDLYSLGAILFRMTVGRPPFTGASPREILTKHQTEPVPSIRSARPELSERLDRTVARLLAKEAEERHSRAATLMRELLLLLPESEWAKLPPPPPLERTTMRWKNKKARRRWIAAAGVLLLAGALFLTLLWMWMG